MLEESLHHRERAQAADMHWQSVLERTRAWKNWCATRRRELPTCAASSRKPRPRLATSRDALAGGRARRASRRANFERSLLHRRRRAEAFRFQPRAANQSDGFRAVGVLADYAEVGQEYESAIEQFLRDELEYVVVETFRRGPRGNRHAARRSRRARNVLRRFAAQTESAAERARHALSKSSGKPFRASIAWWSSVIRSARRRNNFCRACNRRFWWSRPRWPNAWRGKIPRIPS